MPSVALTTAEDKNKVRRALPTAKIYAATVARLYVAYPNPNKWAYANVWGAIAFLKDKKKHSLYMRIIDLINHTGVIWEQEIYDDFQLDQKTPYFFTFASDEFMAGLSFCNEQDAAVFYNKVKTRETEAPVKKKKKKGNKPNRGKLDKSQIGLPSEFRHVGHIGYTPGKGFSVEKTGSEWNAIFDQLQSLGISAEEISQNQDFIKDFVNQRGGPPVPKRPASRVPPPPPTRRSQAPRPPPAVGGRRPPPPPPPSRRAAPPPPAARAPLPRPSVPPAPSPRATPSPPMAAPVPQRHVPPPPVFSPATETYDESDEDDRAYETPAVASPVKSNNPYRASHGITAAPPGLPPARSVPAPPPPQVPPVPIVPSFEDAYDEPDDEEYTSAASSIRPSPPMPPPLPGRDRRGPAPPPPPMPSREGRGPPPVPSAPRPRPPSSAVPPPLADGAIPPPPPLPPTTGGIPPPPPPPGSGVPQPPPPPATNGSAASPSAASGGRGALLDSIRQAGGIGALKKVPKDSQRDRSNAQPGGSAGTSSASASPAGGDDLTASLFSALQNRKKSILADEEEEDDSDGSEWE
ncbi:hypothetical protein DM01DRAFT_1316278 [Hesseltinella vesiculosa]|uniref:WH1-domain-containing protein n=1 Tax=Hesseltinella vesiculosa TaxID=101127 RepID=A0A1X2GU07_9FUNG|nr:hypothetical protein DM01DRAFT_1316278 [Hesseltinella vesiculosa]